MMYAVRLTECARRAIEAQASYIAVECGAPLNAARWLERVLNAIDSLAKWTRRCALAPEDEYRPFEIRSLIVDSHHLVFTIDDDQRIVCPIKAPLRPSRQERESRVQRSQQSST